jgi:hypothetical protein
MPLVTTLTPRAVERLERVRQAILERPKFYDQEDANIPDPDSECGSAGCIFGWVVDMFADNSQRLWAGSVIGVYRIGAELLDMPSSRSHDRDRDVYSNPNIPNRGLPEHEIQRADRLFYSDFWPSTLRTQIEQVQAELVQTNAVLDPEKALRLHISAAEIASRRILRFINTDGAE